MSTEVNQPHVIRLRGPWNRSVVEGRACADRKVTMPTGWISDLGKDFVGIVEYTRHFNRPTGIDEQTMLNLRLLEVSGHAKVHLNGHELGALSHSAVFNIGALLGDHNQLTVRVSNRKQDAPKAGEDWGLVGEVHLEITTK